MRRTSALASPTAIVPGAAPTDVAVAPQRETLRTEFPFELPEATSTAAVRCTATA